MFYVNLTLSDTVLGPISLVFNATVSEKIVAAVFLRCFVCA